MVCFPGVMQVQESCNLKTWLNTENLFWEYSFQFIKELRPSCAYFPQSFAFGTFFICFSSSFCIRNIVLNVTVVKSMN